MRISKNSEDVLLFATVSHRNNLRVLLVRGATPVSISPTRIPPRIRERKPPHRLTLKRGKTHMMRYMQPLLERVQRGEINPSFVVTHRASIDQAPEMYRTFRDKKDHCIKVMMDPWAYGDKAA
jgi:hypothetical protein